MSSHDKLIHMVCPEKPNEAMALDLVFRSLSERPGRRLGTDRFWHYATICFEEMEDYHGQMPIDNLAKAEVLMDAHVCLLELSGGARNAEFWGAAVQDMLAWLGDNGHDFQKLFAALASYSTGVSREDVEGRIEKILSVQML